MKKSVLCLLVFLSSSILTVHADNIEIASFSDGCLTWSNTMTNAVYEVQWASSLQAADWTNSWSLQQALSSTNSTISTPVPLYYRVSGVSYPEVTDIQACYSLYSNALLDARDALASEITCQLMSITTNTPDTQWRIFTNWIDSTTSRWVKVVTMKYTGGWVWNSLLTPGNVTMSNGWSSELWVTPYPELHNLCANYHGTNPVLRIQKALGLPPRSGDYGVAEIFVDPKYLFRPAPDTEINDCSAGLVEGVDSPYVQANPIRGVSPGYAVWFRDTYDSRGYAATNDLDQCYPWTRLGYTYDYANVAGNPIGLSEYVIPDPGQTNYWGEGLIIPLFVAVKTNAPTYGK